MVLTKDLWVLENSFDYLEDLPKGDVRCVELDNWDAWDEWFYRNEKNARRKFDELVEKYGLTVKGNWWKNDFGVTVWIWKIAFAD